MTAETTSGSDAQRLTAESLQHIRFTSTQGRGYNEAEVNAFVSRCAGELEALNGRIRTLEEENRRLQDRDNGGSQDSVLRSVDVLSQAQRTADTTVAQADEYSSRVMAEARSLYENARRKATEMVVRGARQGGEGRGREGGGGAGGHVPADAAGRHPHPDRKLPGRAPRPADDRVRPRNGGCRRSRGHGPAS